MTNYFTRAIFSFLAFASAFLLFVVQPIIGKYLLPVFGGAAAVWTTSMLFFTTLLLIGYIYSHILATRLTLKTQAYVHGGVIIGGILVMLSFFVFRGSPIMPDEIPQGVSSPFPILELIYLLSAYVGVPYFILSTTGPLIQSWFLKSQKTSPYKLYGLSNLGSFVALGAYPFVIEPFLSLGLQGQLWSLAFILFSFVFYICIALLLGKKFLETINFRNSEDVFVAEAENNSLKTKTWLVWLALSALPSFMLFATTNHILYEVAAMPFLWILPLLIYLLSFAVCFEGGLLFKSPVNILALFVGLYPFGFFIAQSWNVVFMYQFLV
ncbi:MAG: hypothetical protein AAB602_00245, partial [Patescibacteria group bacterium]